MAKLGRDRFWRNDVNAETSPGDRGIRQRLREELRAYAFISLYLWVCFGALLLYKNSILRADQLALLPLGSAAIKALILGKFILIGKAIKVGEKVRHAVLLHRILWKSLATLLLLMVFTSVEELAVGLAHGQAIAHTVDEMMDRSWVQWLAPDLVMLLVLIPMIAFEEIDIEMGKGSLLRVLLKRSQPE
jgi:uncharacterized membrane protein YjfL (UPF0719 family)